MRSNLLDSFNTYRRYTPDSAALVWLQQIQEVYCADTPLVAGFLWIRVLTLITAMNVSSKELSLIYLPSSFDEDDRIEKDIRQSLTRLGYKFRYSRDLFGYRYFSIGLKDFFSMQFRSLLMSKSVTALADPIKAAQYARELEKQIKRPRTL